MADNDSVWDRLVDAQPNFVGIAVATAGKTLQDVSRGVVQVLRGHGSEVADRIDQSAAASEQAIQSFGSDLVDRFPNKAGVLAATAATAVGVATLQFGRGMADSARLGTGVAQGTVRGVAEDALRALPIVTPALKSLEELRLARLANAYPDPAPLVGACTPLAIAKALRQAGQSKVFARLTDMIHGALSHTDGVKSLDNGRHLSQMVGDLRRIGAQFEFLTASGPIEDIAHVVNARPNNMVVFVAQWKPPGALEPVAHSLYAFADQFGRLRIADRTKSIVGSLKELENFYEGFKGIGKATLAREVIAVPQARYLTTLGQTPGLGIAVNAVTVNRRSTASKSRH